MTIDYLKDLLFDLLNEDDALNLRNLRWDSADHTFTLVTQDGNRFLLRLEDKQLSVRLTEEAKQLIIDESYDPAFGARPLRRYVQHSVETLLARKILADDVAPETELVVDERDGTLVVQS